MEPTQDDEFNQLMTRCQDEIRVAQSFQQRKRFADISQRVDDGRDLASGCMVPFLIDGVLFLLPCLFLFPILTLIGISAFAAYRVFVDMYSDERNFVERLADYECPSLSKAADYVERLLELGRQPVALAPSQSVTLRDALEMYTQIARRKYAVLKYAVPVARILRSLGSAEDLPALRRMAKSKSVLKLGEEVAIGIDSAIASIEQRTLGEREAKMLLRPTYAGSEDSEQLLRPSLHIADPHPQELLRSSGSDSEKEP